VEHIQATSRHVIVHFSFLYGEGKFVIEGYPRITMKIKPQRNIMISQYIKRKFNIIIQ